MTRATLLLPFVWLVSILSACGGAPPPRPAAMGTPVAGIPDGGMASASASSVDGGTDGGSGEATPEWSYSSTGKRDPFRTYLAEMENSSAAVMTRCNTPLGRFEIEQLKLVAVITGLADPVAMVEAPNGVGYSVRKGACMGKNGGVVAAVRSGEVLVTEWMVRADGTRDRTQTVIKLPKEAALNLEE